MKNKIFTLIVLCGLFQMASAQEHAYHSVLSQYTWHRMSVAHEGVYRLDCATFAAMGINVDGLNPNQIRIFGNVAGALPEKNSVARYDDLSELAIYVSGADDGRFDADDYVLFYAQDPIRWTLSNETYQRERNYYSDSTYFYLCTDSGTSGLRVTTQASLPVEGTTTVITEFPDFQWHEQELFSPYNIGQNWIGETVDDSNPELTFDLVFPNLATDKPMVLKADVYGRSANVPMYYNLRVNDNLVVENGRIDSTPRYTYCVPATVNRQIALDSDTAHVILNRSGNTSALLFLDELEIYAWRQLKRVGDAFPFRLIPSQFGDDRSAIWIQGTAENFWLWDVTDPLAPALQEGRLSAGNFVFATDQKAEHRYFLFNPSKARPIDGWQRIANQDLHAITDADMLIISAPQLLAQAQELADFHARNDQLLSVVVDVNQIFNEFSTGTPDPTGMRDFIRMVYQRSAGNLKYVTLFGRASFDYRNLLGYNLNLVPCYETAEQPNRETSFCTDDYFGIMDVDEGANSGGRVDIGIGRLGATTVEEAEALVNKIKRYADLSINHGDWKTDHLFIADDETKSYMADNEDYESILDTIIPALNINKVYCGAYPIVNTIQGPRIPQATADIVDAFEDGRLAMFYSGHGGVVALADERIFGTTEISALQNADRLPFMFTATCEFSKYDNPKLLSAGEMLFLRPNGGTIAMLTTCRPTYGINNVKLGKALSSVLYLRDENGRPLRMGDAIRMAKANAINFSNSSPSTVSSNICHTFFGDPALRLSIPEETIKTLRINGKNVDSNEIELNAMSMVTIDGEIYAATGRPDYQFNGELWVRLFDQEQTIAVPYATGSINVKFQNDMLYRGKATVRNGQFTVSFQVPKDICAGYGIPRLSYYAYDSIRGIEAMGAFDALTIGGTDPSAVADNEGPKIDFYWNTPDFENGTVVEPQGVLYADLYDAQGIYHYDFSIGRNIMLYSNLDACNNLVLNAYFEPVLDDFRRGRVVLPLSDLPAGTHSFTLKVWDMQENASEASLWFVVGPKPEAYLAQVMNYPNPFSDETCFHFAHYGDDSDFDVRIELFDMMGRRVALLTDHVSTENNFSTPIRWDGCNNSGAPLPTGLYFYRFTITDETGYSRTVNQKLMISR